jgi:bifunctional non-homologous end joining protein LigD
VTSVTLSKPDKVLWPLVGFTKAALAEYYLAVAPALLPHLAGRPVTLRRFPDGVDTPGWYQTNCRGPEWLSTSLVPGRRGEVFRMCRLEEPRALAWAAQVGALELHPLLATADALDRPTALVLDLDPGPPADVLDCCAVALALRDELDALGLASFPKTSGSVGLHVYVPLNTGVSYADTKALARTLAERLARALPERVVAAQKRSLRAGRVLVDWLQNEPMRSTVAPYSLRALPFPTVSTPMTWDEVDRAAAAGRPELLTFLPTDVLARLDRLGDLFRPVLELEQRLPTAP